MHAHKRSAILGGAHAIGRFDVCSHFFLAAVLGLADVWAFRCCVAMTFGNPQTAGDNGTGQKMITFLVPLPSVINRGRVTCA
ncbi:hypothetical protein PF005_g11460 [Phytophthora fragariae]|uniref:Uncharacterized protein n=2 Tax=Phytophthora TaxID=4783 RepID=A0A6A3KR67_9STRA|nr:hypothetical protein PF003_g14359 [Phytophthora fragariae]KAE9039495.1 hypothetical protein PR001_g7473 [Phytophthora rubi]KAE8938107.1 hypothetical protein PF009_g12008 [Phytophthora fragariae]KAE9009811.1 hypothetical protein PF011_g10101 [Phytophthora fragariae]KAE9112683.1 hypothetical protein PF010_g10367 [Phytophthora fragariae]